jgi:hypothetical protein
MAIFTINNEKSPLNLVKMKTNKEFSIPNSYFINSASKNNYSFSNNTVMISGGIFVKNHQTNFTSVVKNSSITSAFLNSRYNIFDNFNDTSKTYYIKGL